MASSPRWIMAYMLSMSAFKISNPIEEFILVKTDNLTRGSGHFCLHWFHVEAEANSTLFMPRWLTLRSPKIKLPHRSPSSRFTQSGMFGIGWRSLFLSLSVIGLCDD
jgi:hypothetical protein